MRYLCLNQVGLKNKDQLQSIAERKFRREFEQAMDIGRGHHEVNVPKKTKRFRSAFTTEQIKYLETEFKKYPYIGSARRKEVSQALNIPERAVKIWFQNRRMKEKKDVPANESELDGKNHKNAELTNDQLNNECTVTSTNNQHYAPLPLISPKNETNKRSNDPVLIKKEIESEPNHESTEVKKNISRKELNFKSSGEFSIELFKQYNKYIGKQDIYQPNALIPNLNISTPEHTKQNNPKSEVSSTSPQEKLPEDLSHKRPKTQPQSNLPIPSQNPMMGYFPLNLKKYYAQPSIAVGNNMVWKPIQVLPFMSTGASAVSISNSQSGSLTVSPAVAPGPKQDCHCGCRCHPNPAPPSTPVIIQQPPSSIPQYVITALPLQNPYFKY